MAKIINKCLYKKRRTEFESCNEYYYILATYESAKGKTVY